jgi:O-antigen ligase
MSSQVITSRQELAGSKDRRSEHLGVFGFVLVFGLCATLISSVLAFGAVEAWSTFAMEIDAAILFILWVAKQTLSEHVTLANNPLYVPAALFFVLVVAQIALRISADTYITKYEALQYVCYGILLLISGECVRNERACKTFAVVMIAFGALYALFALAQDLSPNGKLFWIRTPKFGGSIYGSYVNRNHYAGLMEMLVPIPIVLSLGQLLRGGQRIVVGFCAVLMASTIFLCASRGGMLAFVLEMALLATLIVTRKRAGTPVSWFVMCVLLVTLIIFLSKGQVLGRLGDLSPGVRLEIGKDSLRMFRIRPLLGWGLGSFPAAYPHYRSFYTNLSVNAAHNDYAQLLVETGAPGFAVMLWFLASLYRRALPPSRQWDMRWSRALSLSAIIGCTGILLHSFVDFNLQIPANAALFYVLCALAVSGRIVSSRDRRLQITGSEATLGARVNRTEPTLAFTDAEILNATLCGSVPRDRATDGCQSSFWSRF